MAIYIGSQKVIPHGISKVYVGPQLIYTAEEPEPVYSSTLSSNTWETIKIGINKGRASDLGWLGQIKDGYRLVDLQNGRYEKTDGSGYTKAVFMKQYLLPNKYPLNSTASNIGGWGAMSLKTTLNSTIYDELPTDIKAVISQCKVKSTASGTDSTINSSDNYLFLISEYELYGSVTYSEGGANEGSPIYDYYNGLGNAYRVMRPEGKAAQIYWNRSMYAGRTDYGCLVGSSGAPNRASASSSYYMAPCFAI